jgi:hypothetical protein
MWRCQSFRLSLLSLLLLGGCSQYVADYEFVPKPALAEIPATPPQQVPPVSASVTVIGIHREDKSAGIPTSVEVQFRLDNNGPHAVTFDPQTMELTNSVALKFPSPLVRPPQTTTLAAAQSVSLDALFPFPAGHSFDNTDLDFLHLHWPITIDGHVVMQNVEFRRVGWVNNYLNSPNDPNPPVGRYPSYGGDVYYPRR